MKSASRALCPVAVSDPWARDLRQYQYLPTYGNPGPRARGQSKQPAAVRSRSSSPLKAPSATSPSQVTPVSTTPRSLVPSVQTTGSERRRTLGRYSAGRARTPNAEAGTHMQSPVHLSKAECSLATDDLFGTGAVLSFQAVEQRLKKALARCETFSERFEVPSGPPPPPSSTFLSMRSAVAILNQEKEFEKLKPDQSSECGIPLIGTARALSEARGPGLGERARDRNAEIERSVQAMRNSIIDLNPGYSIGAGPMERMSVVAPELLPVLAKFRKLMQEIHGVDRGSLTNRQRLQAGIKQLQREFEEATRTLSSRTGGAVKAIPSY